MATAPNLVVAGDARVARTLRETGRFPAVFDAASATELRDLSKSGRVGAPAAFMFAPGFTEDVPGAGVAVLANGLAASGRTVLVHRFFADRGDVFDPKVRVTGAQVRLSELLTVLEGHARPPEPAADTPPPRATERPDAGPPPRRAPAEDDEEPAAAAPLTSNAWPTASPRAANPWVPGEAPAAAPRGRVVAIASAKGGVGKTSTSVNLSVFAARLLQAAGRPGSAVLVDTNFQQADVARYLDVKAPTILDLFQGPGALSAGTVRNHLAHVPEFELYALLGPPEAVNADPTVINALLYQRIVRVLRETFDFVFIDTPVAELYHTTFTDLILPEADAILVPVEPNRVTLEAASSWLRAITTSEHSRGGGVDPERLSLVLNRARVDVDCSPEDVMDMMPGWRFIGMIPEDQEWTQKANNHELMTPRPDSTLEATFRGILQVVTADPVFGTAVLAPPDGTRRWRRLLGRNPK